MGAAGSMQRSKEATEHLIQERDIPVLIGIQGEGQWSSVIERKWAQEPFLSVVVLPFLKTLQKETGRKGAALQMLASVKVNDELISLNHSGKSIYFSTASVLMGHSFQDGSPVQVTVQLHADAETVARPQHFLRRLATKINLEASSTSYHVFLGESTLYGSATALNQKWQSKSAMEALVLPFLEFYNSLQVGPEVKAEHVAGLTIEGIVEPTGLQALTASPKEFAGVPGGTPNVHVILRPDVVDSLLPAQGSRTTSEAPHRQHEANGSSPCSESEARCVGSQPSLQPLSHHHASDATSSSDGAVQQLQRIAVLEKRLAEANADDTPLARILDEIRFVRSP